MLKQNKKHPTYEDTDTIKWGRYSGEPLSDVPASYFQWIWENKIKEDDILLWNYMRNFKEAIEMELGEKLL